MGLELAGKATASGHKFNPTELTCASWDYPLGTYLEVTHAGHKVIVLVNDRGPRKDLKEKGRGIDLSLAAFEKLDDKRLGLIQVEVIPLN